MKPSQRPWKWLLVGLLAVLLIAISLIPWLIGDTSRFGDRVATELSDWTGGEVKFTGPVKVSFFPDVSVRGQIELSNSARLPFLRSLVAREAKVSLDLVELLRGRVSIDVLRLLKPRIMLRDEPWENREAPQALIANLLTGAPARVLHIRKGRIKLTKANGGSIRDVYARFDTVEDTGALSGFGSFIYKDATVRYSLESGAVSTVGDIESFPLSLTLASKPIRAKIDGRASFANEFKLDGTMQAEIDDVRGFGTWLGAAFPEGQSLKAFTAVGAFHVAGSTLTFDDGTFTLDGNKAVGLLALTATPARPRVEGTLAFGRFVVDPYLGDGAADRGTPGSSAQWQAALFDRALLQYVDADLRISAAEIYAGALKLGRGGFTITAKQGSVTSEVGELEICGGSADGRISLELAPEQKQLTLDANVADLAIEPCLNALGIAAPVKGTGDMKAELSTAGNNLGAMARNLAGSLKVSAHDGALPVDLVALLASPTPAPAIGWVQNNAHGFDKLDATCRLTGGHMWCQSLTISTPGGSIAGAGEVDLPELTLDWNLSAADRLEPTQASQLMGPNASEISVRGSLSQPTIRRAEHSTLGDRSSPNGAPQALPR
jgi:AsmA protein